MLRVYAATPQLAEGDEVAASLRHDRHEDRTKWQRRRGCSLARNTKNVLSLDCKLRLWYMHPDSKQTLKTPDE